MQIVQVQRENQWKKRYSRLTRWGKATFLLVLAFLLIGVCTIGGFGTPGKAYYLPEDGSAVFYLDYSTASSGDAVQLGAIYVNVGAIYAPAGSDQTLEFQRASASGSYTNSKFSSSGLGTFTIGNVYSAEGEGVSGANYNWVKAFDLQETEASASSYRMIRVTASCDMLLNGIAFFDKEGSPIPAYVEEKEVQSYFDASYWYSYRDLFHANDRTAAYGAYGQPARLTDGSGVRGSGNSYFDFTQDEIYTLLQVDHIRLGSRMVNGVLVTDTDGGPLSALLALVGVTIFGVGPFGLRILPLLFTAALIVVAYRFGKELFQNNAFAFLLACLFAGGGLALTVGRLGTAWAALAFLVVAAVYFMFRFYRRGISEERPVRDACSILIAGLLFALAFAIDPKSVFALIALLPLFVAGVVRQRRSQRAAALSVRNAMLEKNAVEQSEEILQRNIDECERRERSLRAESVYSGKLMVLFFIVSFIAGTVLFVVLSSLPLYYTYVKLYESNPASPSLGIFNLLGKAISDAFRTSNATAYSAANAVSPFGWLIALKGATLFYASGEGVCSALNAQANIAMTFVSLAGFVFMSAYAAIYCATGRQKGPYATSYASGIFSAYFVLVAGMAATLLQYAFCGGASAAQGMAFQVFYLAFIPLAFYTMYVHDGSAKKRVFGIPMNRTVQILAGVCAVFAVLFLLSVPMYFCIPMAPEAANACFGWTTLINNGHYRVG